ncbi:MAG: hypothetical protein WCY59_06930 [Anaerovoracaceae bacterium]
MLSLPPIDNASDTDFTRELKSAIRELYAAARMNRLSGDGSTFYVTQTANGTVGHATAEGGTASVEAKIISAVKGYGNVYLADIYAPRYEYTDRDGWFERETPDEEDATLIIVNLALGGTFLPADTWITAVEVGDHYEATFTGQMCMAKITKHVSGNEYLASIFTEGIYASDGEGGFTLRGAQMPGKPLLIASIASGQVVPNGTVVTAWDRGDHFEANVPRTL